MTTVAIAEAFARFDELLHRSHKGERFLVQEGSVPLACLGPVPAHEILTQGGNFLARARALRRKLKPDAISIRADIAEGRL